MPTMMIDNSMMMANSMLANNMMIHNMMTTTDEEADSGMIGDVQMPFSMAAPIFDSEEVAATIAPFLVRCPKGNLLRLGFAACDLATHSWELLPCSSLFPHLPAVFTGRFNNVFARGGLVMVAKAEESERSYHIVVSNPANKSLRELPPMIDFQTQVVDILGIFVDPVEMSYKIPVVHRQFNPQEPDIVAMQVYDSTLKSWETFGQWRNRFGVEPMGAAYVHSTLFLLTFHRQAFLEGQQQQVHDIYYLRDGEFAKLDLPAELGFFGFPTIFEDGGRLLLSGGIHDQENIKCANCLQSVHVWVFNWEQMNWDVICTMPEMWVEELDSCPPEERRCSFDVTAGGGFVCVASSNGRVAKCNLMRNEWSWLPKLNLEKYSTAEKNLIVERNPTLLA